MPIASASVAPSAVLVACVDRRVPQYPMLVKGLGAVMLSQPGLGDDKANLEFVRTYKKWWNEEGLTPPPMLFAPHAGCRAWTNDEENYNNAYVTAIYMRSHGIPAAAVKIHDGIAPEVYYDGLSGHGYAGLVDSLNGLFDATGVDWQFDHAAVTTAVSVGHVHRQLPHPHTLRLASYGVRDDTIDMIARVVRSHAKGRRIPAYLSRELSQSRQAEIVQLFDQGGVPVDVVKSMAA